MKHVLHICYLTNVDYTEKRIRMKKQDIIIQQKMAI